LYKASGESYRRPSNGKPASILQPEDSIAGFQLLSLAKASRGRTIDSPHRGEPYGVTYGNTRAPDAQS